MKKIVNYRILDADSASKLTAETNKFIERGWQPLGSMVAAIEANISINYGYAHFYQTMVQYADDD